MQPHPALPTPSPCPATTIPANHSLKSFMLKRITHKHLLQVIFLAGDHKTTVMAHTPIWMWFYRCSPWCQGWWAGAGSHISPSHRDQIKHLGPNLAVKYPCLEFPLGMLSGRWLWLRKAPSRIGMCHRPPALTCPQPYPPLCLLPSRSCFPWISPFLHWVFNTYKPFCCCSVDSYVFFPHPLFLELLFFLLLFLLLLSYPPLLLHFVRKPGAGSHISLLFILRSVWLSLGVFQDEDNCKLRA